MKKANVTEVTLKKEGEKDGKKYFIFSIKFDNNDVGDYFGRENPQTYFEVGKEAEYDIETKVNGQYTNHVIKTPQKGGFKAASPVAANKRTSLECAVQLAAHGKITVDSIKETANKFNAYLNE